LPKIKHLAPHKFLGWLRYCYLLPRCKFGHFGT